MFIMALIIFAIIGMGVVALSVFTAVALIWYGWRKSRKRRRHDER